LGIPTPKCNFDDGERVLRLIVKEFPGPIIAAGMKISFRTKSTTPTCRQSTELDERAHHIASWLVGSNFETATKDISCNMEDQNETESHGPIAPKMKFASRTIARNKQQTHFFGLKYLSKAPLVD
jgi:hypothetical protein